MTDLVGTTLGRYRIIEKIGAGGMGVVYRARDERLNRDVAVKVLPAGFLSDEPLRQRFRKEALALSQLSHANIATVYDFDTQDGVDFLVMEFLSGATLGERLTAGALAEREIIAVGGQLASALEEAHDRGIVHRDLKPGNIMVSAKGQAKVLDFGLAKLLRPEREADLTQSFSDTHSVTGTLPYMAPEQLRGEPIDARSDIYAIGVVLYEMATGQRPFREALAPRLTDAILHQQPEAPHALNPRLSPGLEGIILKCVEKDPENRYQSAKELGVDLRRLASGSSAVALTAAPAGKSAMTAWFLLSGRPWKVRALGIFAVVLVAALGVSLSLNRMYKSGGPARIESIAVLPLENLSGDAGQEYFVDGMTEALIADLAQISALRVISRTSVMRYKGAQKSLPEIARELNVEAVVEGSVQRVGDRVKITAQLIEAATDRHILSRSYERDARDVLALQAEVARAIVNEIRIQLTPQETARLAAARPVNPAAHEAYLKGRFHLSRFSPQDAEKSRENFEKALQLDPDYAAAHAGLAEMYAFHGFLGAVPPRQFYAKAKEEAVKALKLDDTLSEAYVSRGVMKMVSEWDWTGAEQDLQRALDLNPGSTNAHYQYSIFLSIVGLHDQAIAEAKRALELDPLSPLMNTNLGWRYQGPRQYDKAIEQFQKALDLDPNYLAARENVARIYLGRRMYREAIAECEKALLPVSAFVPALKAELGYFYALAGQRERALTIHQELTALSKLRYIAPTAIALLNGAIGESDQAFAWMEKAYQDRDPWMIFLRWDSRFDVMRNDPRFQDLVRRMRFPAN